jgi:hypothetical protein
MQDCGAEPWPDRPGVRETFDLLKLDDAGRPSDKGKWVCEQCPPRKRQGARPQAPAAA